MTNAEIIIKSTYPKVIVSSNTSTKGIYNNNRHIVVTESNDTFNVWAFTLKGVNIVNEQKIDDIFISELKNVIQSLIN